MSIRLVAADIDPEEGVMLHLDFTFCADTSDCIISHLFLPNTEAHVRYNLVTLLCTIQSSGLSLYDMISRLLLVRYPSWSHTYYDT